jgi:hypothetical protein
MVQRPELLDVISVQFNNGKEPLASPDEIEK